MGEIVSLASVKSRKAAERGFREWRRLFQSIANFDENTRWADLPDEIVLYFCEESPESRYGLFDLIMGSRGFGSGHDFETQHFDRLTMLMNAYFFIVDQARFECMRRLEWLTTIPRADRSIIAVVMDPASYEYASLVETPEPARAHPAFEEDMRSGGIDRPALVRKHTPRAIELFREKVRMSESSAGR